VISVYGGISTVYISPFGSDSNAGTASEPYLTLSKALAVSTQTTNIIYCYAGVYRGTMNTNIEIDDSSVSISIAPDEPANSVSFAGATNSVIWDIYTAINITGITFIDYSTAIQFYSNNRANNYFTNCTFNSPTSSTAISDDNGNILYLSQTVFLYGEWGYYSTSASTVIATDSIFQNVSIAVYLTANSQFSSYNCTFIFNNNSGGTKSPININSSTFNGKSSLFQSNVGPYGGVFNATSSAINLESCSFVDNSSVNAGGVAYLNNNSVMMAEDCSFSANSAPTAAVVQCGDVNSYVININSVFQNNSAEFPSSCSNYY